MDLQLECSLFVLMICGLLGCAVPVVDIPPSKFSKEEVVPLPSVVSAPIPLPSSPTNLVNSMESSENKKMATESSLPNSNLNTETSSASEDKNPFPTKYLNLNSPEKLAVALPDRLTYSDCSGAFSVWALDRDGFVLNVEKDTSVSLTLKGEGGLYADEKCTKKLNHFTIPKGTSDKRFWFKPGANFKGGSVVISSQDLKGEEKTIQIQPALSE